MLEKLVAEAHELRVESVCPSCVKLSHSPSVKTCGISTSQRMGVVAHVVSDSG